MTRPRRLPDRIVRTGPLVVGTGVAGLTVALALEGATVLTKAPAPASGSTRWAQGGVAAAVGPGDAAEAHAADTISVAAGLADPDAVSLLTSGGRAAIDRLVDLGARFDRDARGRLRLGREAGHGARRVVHADGDATGAEISRALTAAVAVRPDIEIVTGATLLDLARAGDRIVGAVAEEADGSLTLYVAPAVVLATGGFGQVFARTTNPQEVTGDGIAAALRAGAVLADMEFVQFHPTALDVAARRVPLLTEALRGEGAVLIDGMGRRFMPGEDPDAELAPRDVVARSVWRRISAGEPVFLDATAAVGSAFPERFPTVFAACREHGIDPRVEPMPVSPAAHYAMGGIAVDADGRSSLAGLWAVGEAASTGVHGANRLASNSLLEGLVFGARVARSLTAEGGVVGPDRGLEIPVDVSATGGEGAAGTVRHAMWRGAGIERDRGGLEQALAAVQAVERSPAFDDPETRSVAVVAGAVVRAALRRTESRGAHHRIDHPGTDPAFARRLTTRCAPVTTERIPVGAVPGAA